MTTSMTRTVARLQVVTFMLYFVGVCFVGSVAVVAAAIDPGEDFQGYMEGIQQQHLEEEEYKQRLSAHEEWRQTTWGGWVTRQLQAFGKRFAPFFFALTDMIQGEQNAPGLLILMIFLRILVIAGFLVAAYSIAGLINGFLGKEIIIEEEIIVEDDDGDDEPQKNRKSKRKKQ